MNTRFQLTALSLLGTCTWAAAAHYPDNVVNHQPEWLDHEPPERPVPAIRAFFPMGVYGGSYGKNTWSFQLDDLRRHNMNCWWMNGGGVKDDDLDLLVTMGEKAGVRIICADQSAPAAYLFRWSQTTPAQRRTRYERVIAPALRQRLPRFAKRWGIAAWVVSEEMPPFVVDEVEDYVALARELDPSHPPILLYNKVPSAERAAEKLRPDVITTDVYPLGRDPRCAPDTAQRAMALYRRFCRNYYRIARSAGAAFWVMPQAFGSHQAWKPDPPWNGWMGGYYMPNPTFCTWEAWAAIAEGATGIIYYHYYGGNDSRELTMRTEMWNETCQLRAIGTAFGEIRRLAPFLLNAELDDGVVQIASTDTDVRLVGFKPVTGRGTVRLVVAVNDNLVNRREFQLQHVRGKEARIVDLGSGEDVTEISAESKLQIHAGMGKLYAVGTLQEVDAFRGACTAGQP